MSIPIFTETIQSINNILIETANINLLEIIRKPEEKNLLHEILATVSIQIGLTNVLKAIKIQPYRIIGVGSGEITAAYADNYLTLKETILGVFYIVSSLTKTTNGKDDILQKVLPTRKNSYKKWIPMNEEELCKNCAEYFFNNLRYIVNGKDTKKFVVKDSCSLVIGGDIKEISRSTLKLIDANSTDIILDFLNNLGSLYEQGYEIELDKLYPRINLPVSRGTPMLSPLIKWNHDKDNVVHLYKSDDNLTSGHKVMYVNPKTEEWGFVRGHVIDGRNLFPATGYLYLVLECFGAVTGKTVQEMVVVFEDVKFVRATNVPKEGSLELIVMIQSLTGLFEVAERGTVVVTGRVYEKPDEQLLEKVKPVRFTDNETYMTEKDVYKQLKIRGYHYSGKFRNIRKCDPKISKAIVLWENNWVSYMDALLQLFVLGADTTNLYVPTGIQQLVIDGPKHLELVAKCENMVSTRLYHDTKIISCGSIDLRGIGYSVVSRRNPGDPVLEVYKFLPNRTSCTIEESVRATVQVILENSHTPKVTAVEVVQETVTEDDILCPIIQKALGDIPLIQQDLTVLSQQLFDFAKITVINKPLSTELNCLILIVSRVLETVEMSLALNVIHEAAGFIISREHPNVDLSKFEGGPFQILSCFDTKQETLVLLRPIAKSNKNIITLDISNSLNEFEWVPKLQNLLKEHDKVVLYSQNSELNGILGLVNCLKREVSHEKVVAMVIMDEAPKFDPNLAFYKKQLEKNLLINVWKDGVWGTYRHLLLPSTRTIESEHCYVNVTTRGDLSSLTWLEGNLHRNSVMSHETTVAHIYYSALNFRDLMTASGKLAADVIIKDRIAQECILGFEFAGRDSQGRRVMGMIQSGSLATMALSAKQLLYEIPDDWSMEDACTVAVVYGTVFQALPMKTLQPRQSILIHSAAGGIGLAAINLCLHFGLEIFVTVGTEEKRNFIKNNYPQIKEEHIGNSRDLSFEYMIKKYTNNRGVDYVLNSLSEQKLLASIRCLARGGHFVEIGKYDLSINSALATHLLEKDAKFSGYCMDKYLFDSSTHIRHDHGTMFLDLIRAGAIKPLPRIVFESNEIEKAYRHMVTGNHIGKILIKIREEEDQKIYPVPKSVFQGVPRFYCNPNCTYVILGGLGGFGLELADMCVIRGAKKLLLTSKSGICNGYQLYRIRIWESYGVRVLTSTCDASTEEGCSNLLNVALELGPIDGIFNLAAVLRDAVFENQTADNFKTSLAPKAIATTYLDTLSRKLCPNLRYFVIFSSASCGRGNTGQTNYGMANSIMERICEKRKREGYPALAIQWGAIGEVGMVAKMQEDHRELVIGGTLQQRISSCLQVMDKLLRQDEPIVSSMLVAEKTYGDSGSSLFDTVLNIMGVTNLKAMSMHSTFPEIGMDSMMAVEIKQTLERDYEVFLTAQDIKTMTLAKLKDLSTTQEYSFTDTATAQDDIPIDTKLLLYHMGNEEHLNLPVKRMQTLIKENEDAAHILAVPGIEGMSTIFEALAKNLKAHVSCFQFCLESELQTIDDMALAFLPYAKSIKGDIVLLAYSFGCIVATELLRHLENSGRKIKKVIFIDGSADMISSVAKTNFSGDDSALRETMLLCAIMTQYMDYAETTKHKESILACKTYKDRIDYMLSIAPKLAISTKYITDMCVAAHNKVEATLKYTPKKHELQSTLTLFKPTSTLLVKVGDDYGLSEMFQKEIDVIEIAGNHVTILQKDDLAIKINEIIENL